MLQFKINEVQPGVYLIKDPLDVNIFLIEGNEKALLFDTGYGVADTPAMVKSITAKPLTVILGHGHIDHANGAYQFDEVWLREEDYELCREHTSPEIRGEIISRMKESGIDPGFDTDVWRNAGACNLKPLKTGTVYNLGGLTVEVIDMAGHTGGSVGLLLKERRLLIDSDSANSHCWMFMEQSLSLREYIAMLERVKLLEFDHFYVAHQETLYPKSTFDKYISVAANATIEKSQPYHFRTYLDPYIYTEGDVAVVFNERTLKG